MRLRRLFPPFCLMIGAALMMAVEVIVAALKQHR